MRLKSVHRVKKVVYYLILNCHLFIFVFIECSASCVGLTISFVFHQLIVRSIFDCHWSGFKCVCICVVLEAAGAGDRKHLKGLFSHHN